MLGPNREASLFVFFNALKLASLLLELVEDDRRILRLGARELLLRLLLLLPERLRRLRFDDEYGERDCDRDRDTRFRLPTL